MNILKPVIKGSAKHDRELKVLLGLVRHYLMTGKPVGSNTLKETGFENLSSATIRNYFAHLEDEGYLLQHHSSGGRVPTHAAYRLYAQKFLDYTGVTASEKEALQHLCQIETREVASWLQQAAGTLSSLSGTAVFLSAPRFDQDYVIGLRLMPIDSRRCLCVIITDFGVIKTELLNLEDKLSSFAAKRIEGYFNWRLTGLDKPENFIKEEEILAQKIYNELMVRHIVGYSNFVETELYRTGFSKLLAYPEFRDSRILANSLALFENAQNLRLLVKECCVENRVKYWIGDDLAAYAPTPLDCSMIIAPYQINQSIAGAIGLLGPARMSYPELFGLIKEFSNGISEALTRNLYKHKITFRQPHSGLYELGHHEPQPMLLEKYTDL